MSDLFTHLVAARVPGVLVRDRRLVALLVIGTFLPDLASKGLYWVLRSGDLYGFGTHSILGVLALSYLAALFIEEKLRPPACAMLAVGGLIHLAVDHLKDSMDVGPSCLFLPFFTRSVELGWIDPENVVLLVPLSAVILAATLMIERRLARVRQ
jgi:membrane-bound metal-dependent hydrolase YbcI (DUF457 family)